MSSDDEENQEDSWGNDDDEANYQQQTCPNCGAVIHGQNRLMEGGETCQNCDNGTRFRKLLALGWFLGAGPFGRH